MNNINFNTPQFQQATTRQECAEVIQRLLAKIHIILDKRDTNPIYYTVNILPILTIISQQTQLLENIDNLTQPSQSNINTDLLIQSAKSEQKLEDLKEKNR